MRKIVAKQTPARLADPELELRRRAALLARRGKPESGADERAGEVYLEFSLGERSFAVPAGLVVETWYPRQIEPVPGVPDFILGVALLRGEILPVADLSGVLGIDRPAYPERFAVVAAGRDRAELGIAVSSLTGAARIAGDALVPVEDGENRFLTGLADGGTLVVDLDRLLASGRLSVDED